MISHPLNFCRLNACAALVFAVTLVYAFDADAGDFQIGETVLICQSHAVGSDIAPRMFHRAERIRDGRVMITGGIGIQPLPPALYSIDLISIYDPIAQSFAAFKDANGKHLKLIAGRAHHTQTQLDDGRILITGGRTGAWDRYDGRDSDTVEIISLRAGLVTAAPPMNEKRTYHSATKLADGRVLVVGGRHWQYFEPLTNQWSAPYRLKRRRLRHVALLLNETKLLLVAGLGTGGNTFELIDIATNTSKLFAAKLPEHINDHGAAILPDGRILVVGGQKNYQLETMSDCYIFDPQRDRLIRIDGPPNAAGGVSDFQLVKVGDDIVILGGEAEKGRHDTELDIIAGFSSKWLEWVSCGTLRRPRDDAAAVVLQDGTILVMGGAASAFGNPIPTAAAEVIKTEMRLLGDIDYNGVVNSADLDLLRAVVGTVSKRADGLQTVADVNRDGAIDRRDAIALERALHARLNAHDGT